MNWWSFYYNRPLKDPLLQQYTLEELAYEYYMVKHMELAKQERIEAENDRMEQEKWEADQAWADEMERLERLEEAQKTEDQEEHKEPEEPYDPTKDPANIEWMEKHMQEEKEKHGEDFGEDLKIDFGSDD